MKSYTDLEQSKKLADILPLESADMYWKNGVSDKYIQCFTPFTGDGADYDYDIPCWSLAAMLGVIPKPDLVQNSEGTWLVRSWVNTYPWSVRGYSSPVDACYNMIIKLYEQNIL